MFDRIKESEFVVFDCETTGLDFRSGHQIIELAGQKLRDGQVIEEFHELINPTISIEDGAYKVHGLSNLFLSENGKTASEVLPKFCEFAQDTILVGHNILTFDVPFLNADLQRIGVNPVNNLVIDTLIMSRKIIPVLPNHKLSTVALHYDIDPAGAHRAMVDVEMNKQVFLRMLDEYLQKIAEEESKKQEKFQSGKLL